MSEFPIFSWKFNMAAIIENFLVLQQWEDTKLILIVQHFIFSISHSKLTILINVGQKQVFRSSNIQLFALVLQIGIYRIKHSSFRNIIKSTSICVHSGGVGKGSEKRPTYKLSSDAKFCIILWLIVGGWLVGRCEIIIFWWKFLLLWGFWLLRIWNKRKKESYYFGIF